MLICVPIGYAAVEFNGTVKLFAAALLISTSLPLSANTNVYEAVCALVAKSDSWTLPVPISSEITLANSADVVAANTDNLSVVFVSVAEAGIAVPLIVTLLVAPAVEPMLIVVVPAVEEAPMLIVLLTVPAPLAKFNVPLKVAPFEIEVFPVV
jgi:hypothetical protein